MNLRSLYYSLFTICCLTLVGCSSTTKLTSSLKKDGITPKAYQKLAVVVMSPKVSNRAIVEQDLALDFNSRGVKSIPTYDIFPFAGTPETVKKVYSNPEDLQAFVRERIHRNNIDAILIIALYDIHQEERYVQGSSVSIGVAAPGYYDPMYPTYGYSYYGYYSYAYGTVYSNGGYYETTTTYFIESNLYDIESEDLLWTGTLEVKHPKYIQDESKIFANLIVNEVFKMAELLPSK